MVKPAQQINNTQFMFSVICFLQASSLLTTFLASVALQDAWLVVVASILLSLPLIGVYILLIRRFPGQSLVQINDVVFGAVGGKIVSVLYLFFFITLTALNLRDMGGFAQIAITTEVPLVALLVTFMLVCAWSVHGGVEVMTRFSTLFMIVAISFTFAAILFTLNQMDLSFFLPILSRPPEKYLQGLNISTTIPFGELVVFTMLAPFVRKQEKIGRALLGGLLIGGAVILLVVLRDTAVLGNTMSYFVLPSYETLRIASISEALSRVEILFAVVLIILFYTKVSLLYYASVQTVVQITKAKSSHSLVLVTGSVIVIYALTIFSSSTEHSDWGQRTIPILWLFFEFLLPLVTLLVAALRRLPRPQAVNAS